MSGGASGCQRLAIPLGLGFIDMKTHHFIISYDSISKQWIHDIDQEEIHYNDGTVWSEIAQQWSSGYLGDGEHDQEDADLCEKINAALEQLNTNT